MKAIEFIGWAEAYFGEYRPIVKQEVFDYINGWKDEEIDTLRNEAKTSVETKYKTPPDVYFAAHSAAKNAVEWRARIDKSEETFKMIEERRQLILAETSETEEIENAAKNLFGTFKTRFQEDSEAK